MADLVLVSQAEQESSYTANHIRHLLRTCEIKGRKVGGTWLVDIEDLRRYEREMEELGQSKFDPTRGEDEP